MLVDLVAAKMELRKSRGPEESRLIALNFRGQSIYGRAFTTISRVKKVAYIINVV
jgi:hypothetical protein